MIYRKEMDRIYAFLLFFSDICTELAIYINRWTRKKGVSCSWKGVRRGKLTHGNEKST